MLGGLIAGFCSPRTGGTKRQGHSRRVWSQWQGLVWNSDATSAVNQHIALGTSLVKAWTAPIEETVSKFQT